MAPKKKKIASVSLTVEKSKPKVKRKPAGVSSYAEFSSKLRILRPSSPTDKSISQTWNAIKSLAKDNKLSDDDIKKLTTLPPVNGKLKVLTPKTKVLALVSLNKKGQIVIKSNYKPPQPPKVAPRGASAQLAAILRENNSVSVQEFNQIWNQVKSKLDPGVNLKDLVIRKEGDKVRVYAPSEKGVLKVVVTLSVK